MNITQLNRKIKRKQEKKDTSIKLNINQKEKKKNKILSAFFAH